MIRQHVRARLRDGRLDATSNLQEVRGIGPYLERRIARAMNLPPPCTIGQLWQFTQRKTTDQTLRVVHRALQNERCNQCIGGYHAGDINEHGYEAVAALLNWRTAGVRRGSLPLRLPQRSHSARHCACSNPCVGSCTLVDGLCVPRAANARGFLGVSPRPNQVEHATTDAARSRVRRRGQTRMSPALQRDPSSAADLAAGHSRSVRYVRRGSRMWRRPSATVRQPIP
jgi:hypothetical protein